MVPMVKHRVIEKSATKICASNPNQCARLSDKI